MVLRSLRGCRQWAFSGFLSLFLLLNIPFAMADQGVIPDFPNGIVPTTYFATTDKSLGVKAILDSTQDSRFLPIPKRENLSPRKTYWYKMDFEGIELSDSQEWVLRFAIYDKITLYFLDEGRLVSRTSGRMHRSGGDGPYYAVDFSITASNLIEDRYLLAQVNHIYRKKKLLPPSFMHPLQVGLTDNYYTIEDIKNFIPYFLFIGGMMLMVFYSFGIYFMNRDKLFNFYAVYLLTLVLYLGVRLPIFFGPLEMRHPVFMGLYNDLIQVAVNISYLVFAASFLNARKDFPKLHIAIRYAIGLLAGIMALQVIMVLSVKYAYLESYLIQFERYFMIVFALAAYVHIFLNYKSRVVFFLLIGSVFYLGGGIMAMYLNHIKYMMLGASMEVFVFSLGMGYRIKLSEKDKQGIENEMNKVRLTALRAQMNPHFIFNSLNAIRAYVISSDTRKASDYLNKFSFLIRLILQYSSKDSISLREEMDSLSVYVELEQMRFRENFNFTVILPPGFNAEYYGVPPLILQPYVENAIIHGLAPKKGEKHLEIKIEAGKTHLWINIRDNGLGRVHSRKSMDYNGIQHESMAMELTSKRIDLSAGQSLKENNIQVTDLEENGMPAGTEVCIKLPLQKT